MVLTPWLTMLLILYFHHWLLCWVLHWLSPLHHLHETNGSIISSICCNISPASSLEPSLLPSTLITNFSHNHLDPLPHNLPHHPLHNFTIDYPLYLLHLFSSCSFAISSLPLSPLPWPYLSPERRPPWRGSPHLTTGTLLSTPTFLSFLPESPYKCSLTTLGLSYEGFGDWEEQSMRQGVAGANVH